MTDHVEEFIRVPPERNGKRSMKAERSRKFRYGRIPDEILTDARLSHAAVRLYGIMAMYAYEGNVVTLGIRKMAAMRHVGLATVHRLLKILKDCGHIATDRPASGKRSFYELTSPVFAQKQGKSTVIRSSPRGKRMVSVAPENMQASA